MARIERVRELLAGPISPEYLAKRAEAGWQLVALEWQREIRDAETEPSPRLEEVPFGLKVSSDCMHLEENPAEMRVLTRLTELIVQDATLTRMAQTLNEEGLRMRDGRSWTTVAVFNVLPRVVELSPRILSSYTWPSRRVQVRAASWNS